MTALLTSTFRNNVASSVLSDIQYGKSKYYHFIGKVASWGNPDTPPSVVTDTIEGLNDVRNELVLAKRVEAVDVSLVVDRIDWVSGIVYSMWDSSVKMDTTNFYVLTPDFRVYVCLDNNRGSASTVKPDSTGSLAVEYADKYIWKYMYTVGVTKRAKFLSLIHMPVQQAVSDRFYNNGSVSSAAVLTAGSGYVTTTSTVMTVSGGAGCTLIPSVSSIDGSIVNVTIINSTGGGGYLDDAPVTITGIGSGKYGDNLTATFRAFAVGGIIQHVAIIDPGKNYHADNGTTISVNGDGKDAMFTPVVYDGKLVDVIIESPGTEYTYCTLNVNSSTGSGATIKTILKESDFISDQSVIEQTSINGAIYAIKVVNGGSLYNSATVTVAGDGSGCTATAEIYDGQIVKIHVITPGKDYSYANVTIVGDNILNKSASASAIYSPIGGHGKNAPTELFARTLAIHSNLRGLLTTDIQQDFRQYGLLTGVRDYLTGVDITSKSAIKAYISVVFSNTLNLVKDEILVSATAKFRVLSINGNTVNLVALSSPSITPVGTLVADTDIGRSYTCTEQTSVPDFDKYTGQIIYYSDDPAFTYSDEQSVIVKTFIRF